MSIEHQFTYAAYDMLYFGLFWITTHSTSNEKHCARSDPNSVIGFYFVVHLRSNPIHKRLDPNRNPRTVYTNGQNHCQILEYLFL